MSGQVNGVLNTSYLARLQGGLVLPGTSTVWLTVAPAGGHIGEQGSQWISTTATGALGQAGQAFRQRTGRALHVVEAWRSDETQEFYFLDRYVKSTGNRPTGINWNGFYWVKRAGVAAAAIPRTSNHGWGLSVDLGSTIDQGGQAYRDWKAVAEPHGWRNDVSGEPWHWTYYATLNTAGSGATPFPDSPTPGTDTPTTPPEEEDNDMRFAIWQGATSGETRTLLVDLDTVNPMQGTLINADESAARRASGTKFVAGLNQSVFDSVDTIPDAPSVRVVGFDPSVVTRIQTAVMDLADDKAPRFTILYGHITGTSAPYMLDAEDGKRRPMTAVELSVWRASDANISETTMQQADFDAIPKRV